MIKPTISIRGKIKESINIKGKINLSIIKEYPELENVEITPTLEDQTFKPEKYGFKEVKVKGVDASIDEDIKPENIKEGTEILGVSGSFKGIDTSDATALAEDILAEKTAYVNNQKIEGTIQEYDGSYSGNVSEGLKITNASYLFYYGARTDFLTELLNLCENISSMKSMFEYCNINHCPNLDFSMLDLSMLDTSNVTNMSNIFAMSAFQKINLSGWNTINVTSMAAFANNCTRLEEINFNSFNTSNVESMNGMFLGNTQLVTLDLSSFDMSKVETVYNIFSSDTNLTNLKSFKNLGKGYTKKSSNYSNYKLDLSACTKLTYESLIDVITNGLYDLNLTYNVANGGTLYRQSLVLGSTNLAKLTAEEIAIATNKGWNVT